MNTNYKKKFFVLINIMVMGTILTFVLSAKNLQSQTLESPTENIRTSQSLINFNPPPGVPDTNIGGGKRGNFCNQNTVIPFIPLFPANKEYHLTSVERPNFYLYLPETTTIEGHFFLDNYNTGEEIYYGSIPITNSAGIITIEFPENAPPLEENIIYKWGFGLICDNNTENMDFVEGLIKKVDFVPEENSQISLELAKNYAQNSIWYDALDQLIQLHQAQPNNEEILLNLQTLLRQGEIDETLINSDIYLGSGD